ncbi:hypothetical protein TSA6c_17425 [Azospirillum sp. TSA6c]|uniref:hypothetical protein n=1 Tax=Azospirillum sp. TSA6c TaxID=709813 RepID=UPI000D6170F2|nr:hypothetical protein [Azospirillum sp. TSA6c]PWC48202.1 hypothetical protein TSA6c_17425 [Azospirillum sp. TSA6c]
MKKFSHLKHGDPLTGTEQRFVDTIQQLLHRLGHGPTVTEMQDHWPGCRSGIVELAHSCRAKGALTWGSASNGRPSWRSLLVSSPHIG